MTESKQVRFIPATLALTVILLLGAPGEAKAYIDPGTGTLIWQVLSAAMIGFLFYVRKFSPLRWFRGLRKKHGED